jgi:hypothetical protein
MQWQPIETAPKDGTVVLVAPGLGGRSCSIAVFNRDQYARNSRPFWSRLDGFGMVSFSRSNPPTHWMPLPTPPGADA